MKNIPFSPLEDWVEKLNKWGTENVPFYFLTDFSTKLTWAGTKNEAESLGIYFSFDSNNSNKSENIPLKKFPISLEKYKNKFQIVQDGLKRGDSFLVNLTQSTRIESNYSLKEIYLKAIAPYKLYLEDEFVVFSPEKFIQIENGKIQSFPMKGTISASIPNSREILLNDSKENAEHATIVDLIRNDISKIAHPIEVLKYKYLDLIKTNQGNLWQMSSIIEGKILKEYQNKFGSILKELLPAGSISGAPKLKTLELIKEAEQYDRRFYTGIMGYFDGKKFNSGVMIRFIEKKSDEYYFKSGGGITVFSNCEKEYEELIQKIYLPF
ncbi:MAG: Aminodeoxychorismate synthase [Bacteroidota bacterium]|jgi:para-aminobenzoate synthetase component 1